MSTLRVNTIQDQPGTGLPAAGQLGVGQTWQNVTASRGSGVTYTNSSGRPIQVLVTPATGASPTTIVVSGATLVNSINTATPIPFVVPAGATYAVTPGGGVAVWYELR